MFGYIVPEKPELKIKDYELYRAYYCGVCKSIGDRYGIMPRISLTYDAAFLAILLSAFSEEKSNVIVENCIIHPIKKMKIIRKEMIVDYAADINILLAYCKMKDDWKDDKSIKSVIGITTFKRSYKKLKKSHYEKYVIIEKRLQDLSKLEKEKCDKLDMAAEPFAKLMEEIISFEGAYKDKSVERILRWFGYNIGKWIYTLDAFDDIENDIKNKSYNPFLLQYRYNFEDINEFKNKIKPKVEFNLTYILNEISKAYELLELKKNKDIIENIIYFGMLRKTEQILCTGSCRESD